MPHIMVELSEEKLAEWDALVQEGVVADYKEIFDYAMTILMLTIKKSRQLEKLAFVDSKTRELSFVSTPLLDRIRQKSS